MCNPLFPIITERLTVQCTVRCTVQYKDYFTVLCTVQFLAKKKPTLKAERNVFLAYYVKSAIHFDLRCLMCKVR